MLFNSFEFLLFFGFIAIIYYLLDHRYRWGWLLLASYYFYMDWKPSLAILLFVSTVLDYFCGLKIHQHQEGKIRKRYLYLSIGINIGLLVFFKYLGFFTETTLDIFRFFGVEIDADIAMLPQDNFSRILLPIGISFYTFQTLSYTIEIFRRTIEPERHFGRYALYVSFFPQLVAGPIERANQFLPQLRKKIQLDLKRVREGIILMAWGYFMKLAVADRLGIYVDEVFADPSSYPGIPLLIGTYFFTFQIYFDFAAYSVIAIGAARILGFDLMSNFERPVFSRNANEFWRRWHISLMTWLRDYLYRPLAINARMKSYLALMIVFLISGLWHGANWTFVVWGGLNGLFLLMELGTRNFRRKTVRRFSGIITPGISRFSWWFITFNFIVFSLVFFRAPTVGHAVRYLRNMLRVNNFQINEVLNDPVELLLCFLFIIFVQVVHYFKSDKQVYELVTPQPAVIRWGVYLSFIVVIVFFSINRKNPFIYFQF